MAEGWPNPFGGLLSFGHALGASGLVQVNKAHHLFCGDHRYIRDGLLPSRPGFGKSGAVAFATSVGGPLSHIVAALFRGGFEEVPAVSEPPLLQSTEPEHSMNEWRAKRNQLRRVLPSFRAQLRGRIDGEPWFVEGTTYVSIRSALRALSADDIARLTFDGLERLVARERLEEMRGQLREVVVVVVREADRVESMFDAFRLLTDEVSALSKSWRAAGFLSPPAEALSEGKLAIRVKDCLRVPLAVLCGPRADPNARRRVLFLPAFNLTHDALEGIDLLVSTPDGSLTPAKVDPSLLPFWNARARRPTSERAPQQPASATELIDRILEQREHPENAAELELLRLWFAAEAPRLALERALQAAGSMPI